MVYDQIETVFAKFAVKSVKTGMLHNNKIIEAVASALKNKDVEVVIDPVMISTSGAQLLEDDAVDSMKEFLFPLSDWITPNIPEAEKILGVNIKTRKEIKKAAREISDIYKTSVVLKGGHANSKDDTAVDVVSSEGNLIYLSSPLVDLAR
jgi:hydroxymethylpyrimidine/phosphomethylpyrimidine kinase